MVAIPPIAAMAGMNQSYILFEAYSPVVELRQYTLHPGQRDVLIELFEREFVESQEAVGIRLIGQFRDLDDPDRFVWLRGFADMPARARALQAFYGGPAWHAHRDAANPTMVDSDNVLQLRPAYSVSGFQIERAPRAPAGANGSGPGLVVATLYHFDAAVDEDFLAFFADELVPALGRCGASVSAALVNDPTPNNFPTLPVREGEHVFAWFARFADARAHGRHCAGLNALPGWRDRLEPALLRRLARPPETLRLAPTARSSLHG